MKSQSVYSLITIVRDFDPHYNVNLSKCQFKLSKLNSDDLNNATMN